MFYYFNEQRERAALMSKDTTNPQISHPLPGITRAMQQAFFDRRDTYFKTGVQQRLWVHTLVFQYPKVDLLPFGVVKFSNKDGQELMLNSKKHAQVVRYVKMLVNKPIYWSILDKHSG